jgi:pyrroline-5-carboxylate reductase
VKLGLIGAGNMASALARGIGVPALVADIDREKAVRLAEELGGEPKQLEEVAADVDGRARVVISILAAVTTERLEAAYPDAAVYRFIPNIPAEVRRGVLCYTPGARATAGPEAEILDLFGRAGTVIRLDDEPLIEPAMALMSCGPAFMALVAEAFADAGADHGLGSDDAVRMTVETMAGTAAYLAEHGYDTAALRARVATPGGATERGLIRLEDKGMRQLCRSAVDAVVEMARQ